jgi:hypothetical protein
MQANILVTYAKQATKSETWKQRISDSSPVINSAELTTFRICLLDNHV